VGLLKEIIPRLSRIAIFGIPGLNEAQFAAAKTAVQALRLESEIIELRSPDDLEGALAAATTKHAEAGILLSSPLVFLSSKQIGELALAKRLPLISLFAEFPRVGDLPIQRPERFDLVINLKTAAALGLDMPSQLQQLADEVIE
jgi:putative tryptophan/tyrosine transport system substrate-binding protein